MKRLRFGLFDFDPETRELRREGVTVRLQAQPAQVLGYLVTHAGEVVSRTELREEVWSDGTFVDFDQGLNFCVAQIRAALGDTADSPRFIRTVPKRGYQFIAPVAAVGDEPAAVSPPAVTRSYRRVLPAVAFIAVVMLAAIFAGRWSATREATAQGVTVAVARFDNETGSADMTTFADGLTDSLVAELTNFGAGQFSVIGNASILRLPRGQRDLKAIATNLNANYIVLGQVQQSEARVRILAHLIRLPDQKHLRVSRSEFDLTEPLAQQRELAQKITTELTAALTASRGSKPPSQ